MKIKCAAIRVGDTIYEGKNHSDLIYDLLRSEKIEDPPAENDQGFVTECGVFASREAALILAIKAGQISGRYYRHRVQLQSQDLI